MRSTNCSEPAPRATAVFKTLRKEMLELVRRELVYPLGWVDPRLKQYLVGVDIPDAGDHLLLHQETHPSEGRLAVRLPNELKRSRHPEMQRQPAASINICHEVLAVTPDCNELGAFEAGSKCPDRELAEDPCVAHHDLVDRLAQRILCKHAFEAFDIRQFWHLRVYPPVIRMQRRLSRETGTRGRAREWRPTLLAAHGAVE